MIKFDDLKNMIEICDITYDNDLKTLEKYLIKYYDTDLKKFLRKESNKVLNLLEKSLVLFLEKFFIRDDFFKYSSFKFKENIFYIDKNISIENFNTNLRKIFIEKGELDFLFSDEEKNNSVSFFTENIYFEFILDEKNQMEFVVKNKVLFNFFPKSKNFYLEFFHSENKNSKNYNDFIFPTVTFVIKSKNIVNVGKEYSNLNGERYISCTFRIHFTKVSEILLVTSFVDNYNYERSTLLIPFKFNEFPSITYPRPELYQFTEENKDYQFEIKIDDFFVNFHKNFQNGFLSFKFPDDAFEFFKLIQY